MCDSSEPPDVSVCHTINTTFPSLFQPHDSSGSQPKCDSTWSSVHPSVCLSTVLSIQSSVFHGENTHEYYWMKFPISPIPGKIPFCLYIIGFICQSIRQYVSHCVTIG